jgi:hypothetical protein
MVCVVVPLLLKRNVGVLFGALGGPRNDVPFFCLLWFCICGVYLFPFCCVMPSVRGHAVA